MRRICSQSTCLLFVLLFVPAESFAMCTDNYEPERSSTCWGGPTKSRPFPLIEISRKSIYLIISEAKSDGSPLLGMLNDLAQEFVERRSLKSVIFKLDEAVEDKSEATDCWLYGTKKPLVPDWGQKVMSLGAPDCYASARLLSVRVAMREDKERTKIRGAHWIGFELAFLNLHKQDPALQMAAAKYANRSYSATAISLAYHGLSVEDVPGAQKYVAEVRYPFVTIKLKKGDTLGLVAQRFTGSAQDWPAIWVMNTATVDSPHAVREGQEIRIPHQLNVSDVTRVEAAGWMTEAAERISIELVRNCGSATASVCQGMPTTRVFLSASD